MSRHTKRILPAMLVLGLAVITCNLPSGTQGPALSNDDLINTAAAKALTAQAGAATSPAGIPATPIVATTAAPIPTQCSPLATASTDANVRTGPGTLYDVIGYLPAGATAPVAGKNDAGTWWYIQFAGGYGGYAWVAMSVTTSSCIPAVLQVVAAPPLPTAVPATATPVPVAKPDLYVSEYSWSPDPPHMGVSFHVRVGAYNKGNGPAGGFTVQWWLSTSAPAPGCTWHVASLVAHGGRILECDYVPAGWANYPSQVVVDSGDDVDESHEGNNTSNATIPIKP